MSKKIRILSIDGGGIRGILAGELIAALENKLQNKSNQPNARISDYFDLVVGTSTGGILTCLYLCPSDSKSTIPLFSAREAVNLYIKYGGIIFKPDVKKKVYSIDGVAEGKYPAQALESTLFKYLQDFRLSQLLKPCLITSYDIYNRQLHLFRKHEAEKKPSDDYYLRDVARATSAAPTYFETARIKSMSGDTFPLVDGGLYANNPAMFALSEAMKLFSTGKTKTNPSNIFLLSVGTGSKKEKYDYEKVKTWGILRWVEPLLDITASGTSDATDFHLKQLFESEKVPHQYIRIEPETGTASSEMDNASPANIQALIEASKYSSQKYDSILESIANDIINNHGS